MAMGQVGLTITMIGCVLGALLIIFGGSFYLFEKENKFKIVRAVRTMGIGIIMIMASIPFSIPNRLLVETSAGETSIVGVIILSIFLGSPLICMGLASYVGLNAKAQEKLYPVAVEENPIAAHANGEDILTY